VLTSSAACLSWSRKKRQHLPVHDSSHGIQYDVSERVKSTIYGDLLPALNSQRVRLLDLPRLSGQLAGLERRTHRGGKDSIDHGQGLHDDVANAAGGVLTLLIGDRRPALARQSDMLTGGAALPLPRVCCRTLVATSVIDVKTGMAATIYLTTLLRRPQGPAAPACLFLDYDYQPFHSGLFTAAAARFAS
jgi:hypothetical protein